MFCGKVKEFLSQKGVAFTERNVAADEVAMSELKEFGYMTTPVTVVDGDVVVGFNPSELEGLAEREAAASTTSGGGASAGAEVRWRGGTR